MTKLPPAWPAALSPAVWGVGTLGVIATALARVMPDAFTPDAQVRQLVFLGVLAVAVATSSALELGLFLRHPERPRFVLHRGLAVAAPIAAVLLVLATHWLVGNLPLLAVVPVGLGVLGSLTLIRLLRLLRRPRAVDVVADGFQAEPMDQDGAGDRPVMSRRQIQMVLTALDRVCGIRWVNPDGSPGRGTGFLVGPDLVLTARHVVDGFRHAKGKDVAFAFEQPTVAHLAVDWPQGEGARSDDDDWALIRISKRLGELPAEEGSAVPREWYRVEECDRETPAGAPATVLGFPDIQPIHGEGVVAQNPQARFVWYTAGSAAGVSGGPCFVTYKLAALHKGSWDTQTNRGVLLKSFLPALETALAAANTDPGGPDA